MSQQLSPWIEAKWGWNYGESGWHTGADENWLKFSYMFDRNVDGIVASLPTLVNGQAYFLTTDNRLYFAVAGLWYSTSCPKWFEFKIRSSGDVYQFNGTSAIQIESPAGLESRLDAVELTLSTLGTAAFQDSSFFATQAELDVAEAQAAAYTDTLRNDLSSPTGADIVGYGPSLTVEDELNNNRKISRTIESFGSVDTPVNTKTTLQAAINFCASNNILLVAGSSEYTVDLSTSSITLPNNFKCDLGNAWIKRATGNTTPQDMWINSDTTNGNTGLDIRNVRFDGQRQADSLTNATAAHRFCGLRLVKCSGYLENVRVNNTVNGEIQVEGNRGGIMFDQSVDISAFRLFADGTMGSGVFCYQGKNYIHGVWTKNNTGSGFTSYGCDDNDFHHIYSDGSGYSGVSVNGERMRCSYLCSKNSPVGFAGVNIGHDNNGNRATDSQIDNVMVESAAGWGITCIGSPNVSGSNWRSSGSAVRNLWVSNSAGVRIAEYKGRQCAGNDAVFEGAGDHFIDADISGSAFSGIVAGTSARVTVSAESLLTGNGTGGGTTGALLAQAGTEIIFRGKAINNLRYGAISSGVSALVRLPGALVTGNTVANTLATSSGTITYENTRLSNTDQMEGTFTIASGTSSLVVNNGNVTSANRIVILPGDAAGRTAGQPVITAVSAGVSFTATLSGNAAANALYRYMII